MRSDKWQVQLLFALILSGCSVVTDSESLEAGCPDGEKLCGGECVSLTDEDYGCARAGCSPCDLHRATAQCSPSGECAVSSCVGTWSNCDRESENGCEVDVDTDVDNCRTCDNICEDTEYGEAACGNATCYIRRCESPYLDCNFDIKDGCEVDSTSDPENCGDCEFNCSGGECADSVCE